NADMVITGGGVEEGWAVEGFDQPYRAGHILRLDLLPAAKESGGNTRVWLDPDVMKAGAPGLAQRLATLRPREEDQFRRNAAAFDAELDALLAGLRPRVEAAPNKKVLVLG